MGDIEESLVDGNRFDEVGVFLEDAMYLLRHLLVMLMAARHDDETRTTLLGLGDGLRRVNAKLPCLIACRGNDTTRPVEAHRYRFASKFGVVSLLYRGKESIHVDVYNLAIHLSIVSFCLQIYAFSEKYQHFICLK